MRAVYDAANLIDAHLVRHVLEEAGIPVYLKGEALLGGMGELPLFGLVQVCVPDAAWPEAQDLVATMPLNEPPAAAAEDGPDMLPEGLPA